jgi:cation diffusion facilitator family transporter
MFSMTNTPAQQELREATRVTLIGSVLDLVLGILKIAIGILSSSLALVSDGIHSLSDLVTDIFVILISRVSHAEPDLEHPYGHRRFETLGTIILGIVLFTVAGIICFDSLRRLGSPESLPVPGWAALLVTLASIGSKEWIYRYTKKVADAQNSSLLLANAWHSRTDAISSIAVLVGIIGIQLGYVFMDTLAAVFVALMIGRIAWQFVASSLNELVDTALPADKVNAIRQHALALEGILGAHALRTRLHGGRIFLDLHVQVDDRISVSEGHYLADRLASSLKQAFPEIRDIVVHVDPEPDTDTNVRNTDLPLRPDIAKILEDTWRQVLPEKALRRMELHYLENQVEVDIYLDISLYNNDLEDNLNILVKDLPWLAKINFFGMH